MLLMSDVLGERGSGIILHPTSLPGPNGIGDLGPAALEWVDFLAATGTRIWQVLPLGPTGYGDSPYQSPSTFAGNPNLIALEPLLDWGLLEPADLADRPSFPPDHVDFPLMSPWKMEMLDLAHRRFRSDAASGDLQSFERFCADHAGWVDDFGAFMALKERFGGRSLTEWPGRLQRRDPKSLAEVLNEEAAAVATHVFRQFLFFRQWEELHRAAYDRGVIVFGDIPIYVAGDSAEVWLDPELFTVDADLRPTLVSGVPPDYFSATGQLWGNPLYLWEKHAADGFAWWERRLRAVLAMVDVVRLDHFRGFADYWEIPGDAPTAEVGEWRLGPGKAFFEAIEQRLGGLPIIAEDLGTASPVFHQLREELGVSGMKVLQLAFIEEESEFLPHQYPERSVAYTGTHDNDTTLGWWHSAPLPSRTLAADYLGTEGSDVVDAFLEAVWASAARWAIAPMQDLLELGTESRMNTPGTPTGNWRWRMTKDALTETLIGETLRRNERHGRSALAVR